MVGPYAFDINTSSCTTIRKRRVKCKYLNKIDLELECNQIVVRQSRDYIVAIKKGT